MSTVLTIFFFTLLAVLGIYLGFWIVSGLRSYFAWRGKRLVRCPETRRPAAVEVDAGRARREALLGAPHLRLRECSRWPERRDCGQECLSQIESAPLDCLVRTIVTRWYEGKSCAYCGRMIHEVEWLGHKPALSTPEKKTLYWDQVPAEKLLEVFATHSPVCWDCHIAETFRHEHPDLVVDRPAH